MHCTEQVFVIIINFNSGSIIQNAIRSINEDNLDIKIIILDNNSTDNSVSLLDEITDPRVDVILSCLNLGFSGGCNKAYEYIKMKYGMPKYIMLFNPDAIAISNLIFNLKRTLESSDNNAVVSPKILKLDSEIYFAGSMINWKKLQISNEPNILNNTDLNEIDVFNGCSALIKTNSLEELGKFNEDLFMYYDEADFSMKLKENGYKIFYDPSLIIRHDESYTTRNTSHIREYYLTRNSFMFFMVHSPHNKAYSFTILLKNFLKSMAYLLTKGQVKDSLYSLLGLIHFLQKKHGKL